MEAPCQSSAELRKYGVKSKSLKSQVTSAVDLTTPLPLTWKRRKLTQRRGGIRARDSEILAGLEVSDEADDVEVCLYQVMNGVHVTAGF